MNSFSGWNLTIPRVIPGNEHAWMMFPIVLDETRMSKTDLVAYLNSHLVETRDMMPIVSQPIYRDLISPGEFPVAEWVDRNGFYIGCHQDLEPADLEYIRGVFEGFDRERVGGLAGR
jgi:dTDP-4-amino-4,6-dideoxygalactose transaminase